MVEIKNINTEKHSVTLSSREKMIIDGVKDVLSFDEGQASLVTACGEAVIEGNGIHVTVLDLESGRVELEGKIDGFFYQADKDPGEKRRGFFSRLFS